MQLAISIGGSVEKFAELMNNKAIELGLFNTHFVTPHGLDEDEHYTTAYELAKITDYALTKPKIKEIVSTQNYNVLINNKTVNISNTNELLGYLEGVNGVKTGYTGKAGRCLVTSVNRNGFEIITVVLGADTKKIRTKDSINLIEYAYKEYQIINLESKIEKEFYNWNNINSKRVNVNKGQNSNVELELNGYEYKEYVVKNDEIEETWIATTCQHNLEAPIEKGKIIGNMSVNIGNRTIMDIDIYVKNSIKKKNIYNYIYEILLQY